MDDILKELAEKVNGFGEKIDAATAVVEKIDPEAFKTNQEDIEKAKKDLAEYAEKVGATEKQLEQAAKDVAELRKYLTTKHGEEGADTWSHDMAMFIKGAFNHRFMQRVPDECKIDGYDYDQIYGDESRMKAYTVGTGATMGYLVPEALLPGVIALRQVFGKIMPRVTKLTVPALSSLKANFDDVMPTASYQLTEGNDMSEESSAAIAQDTLTPKLIGTFVKIQNELLNFPGIGFSELMAVRMMRSMIRLEEVGIIGGTVAGGYPSEGIISTTNVFAQTALATATIGNILTFIAECVADYEASEDTLENTLLISPARYYALAGEAVGTNVGAALAWANPKEGIPPRLFGYELVPHPGALVSTTHSIVLGNMENVIFGQSGEIAIDFNPFATGTNTGWTANQTWMRVMTHSDWVVGAPKGWHKATITA